MREKSDGIVLRKGGEKLRRTSGETESLRYGDGETTTVTVGSAAASELKVSKVSGPERKRMKHESTQREKNVIQRGVLFDSDEDELFKYKRSSYYEIQLCKVKGRQR